MSKRHLGCISAEPEEGCQSRLKRCGDDCVIRTYRKWFLWYHLPCSFKNFINAFGFLYVKANSKEICEEIFFPSLFQKNADVSIFVDIQS